MVAISFENKLDGIMLYERLTELLGMENIETLRGIKVNYTLEEGMTIHINIFDAFYEVIKPSIINIFTNYILETNEERWILEIVEKSFYYFEKDEQEQILAITQSILEGEKDEVPKVDKLKSREKIIGEAISGLLKPNHSFTYESFLKFRLKDYFEQMTRYVEIAIDEYKLEQEYQEIVDQLRKKVNGRVPLFSKVHLVDQQPLKLYNEHFYEFTEDQLQELLKKLKVPKQEVPLDSLIIKALVSFAPREVLIYTNNPDRGEIHTILNVFQERVRLSKLEAFETVCGNHEKA